ncbi:hypothetical protein BDL97_02G099300 [Sphagnum fallax]|nr:hypothetical protein BDL97_02G099300 [Sphagnum fallax]KAH8970654.1 hypothetical protein BDL97_02G099300 [Sphagnum fallax]
MGNVHKGKRHWNYFHKCKGRYSVTFVGVVNACASLVALEEGRCAQKRIIQSGWDSDVFVGSSLVDMYTKCGSMEDAQRIFNKIPSRNVVTWNAMILGQVQCGQGQKSLELFQQMQQEACSHAGLVHEGTCFYASMKEVYMISPTMEHYTCMVDLLGRAGHLQEAENMIKSMPCKPHFATCIALLGACTIHGNVEMGERVAKQVMELESENAAGYVLLANIYAASGNRHLCEDVEWQRKERGEKAARLHLD